MERGIRVANPPACYRSLSGPKVSLKVSLGPFGPRAPECPKSVSGTCFRHFGGTLATLFGHSGARGLKGPRDTSRDAFGTLRARRARETLVAGRGVRKIRAKTGFLEDKVLRIRRVLRREGA